MHTIDPKALERAAHDIMFAGREFAARGWTPATSSNFSARLSDELLAVTVSGKDKGALTPADVMVVDMAGAPVNDTRRPSAETLLHCHAYRTRADLGAVVHTHSLAQTIVSKLFADQGFVELGDYELLKAFSGTSTHQTSIRIPVFANTQDMHELAAIIAEHERVTPIPHGYLIEGHGIYTWGTDMAEARRQLDAFEFLFQCELELRKLRK